MSRLIQFLIVLGVSILSGSRLRAADPPKGEVPKPLPKEMVATWQKAGMEVGWSEVMRFGELAFHPAETRPGGLACRPSRRGPGLEREDAERMPAPETASQS